MAEVQVELRRGDWFLASVATTAPLLSVLASLDAFLGSFPGFAGERWAIYAMVMDRLANTLVIAAAGLVPAMIAHCGVCWINTSVDRLTFEMNVAVADLPVHLQQFAPKVE